MDWHWEFCPLCASTGIRARLAYRTGGGGSPATFNEPCGACDGFGRLRVPNNWHLAADPVTVTVTMIPTVVLDPAV